MGDEEEQKTGKGGERAESLWGRDTEGSFSCSGLRGADLNSLDVVPIVDA